MLNFIVNNKEVRTDLSPGSSLVDYLRDVLHLYGTKIGCREGDCGACTILVGELKDGEVKYETMASCLMPLGNANRKHVVTIEGINGDDLTPIQSELIAMNGTQCGFCTPGVVLSLYGFCLSDKPRNLANAIEALGGNICRCTGYKSIERAAAAIVEKVKPMGSTDQVQWLVRNKFLPGYFQEIPERLRKINAGKAIEIKDSGLIIAGGTDLLLQDPETAIESEANLIFGASEYKQIKFVGNKCYIGATSTFTDIKESKALNRLFPAMDDYVKLVASTPVRNMATVGGNIANGSPIGDLSVMLMALDAVLVMKHKGRTREMTLKEFFAGYKKVKKDSDELIEWIYFDAPDERTLFSFEKICKRDYLDMATVNSAMRVVVDNGTITKASFAVGGLGPTIRSLEKTAGYLVGKRIDNQTFKQANRIAQTEITPRSRAEYKRSLVRQQLFIHLMNFSPQTVSLEALQ
jgi:xanthine dehydrogenase small subunit